MTDDTGLLRCQWASRASAGCQLCLAQGHPAELAGRGEKKWLI